jgi:hypothetical protein
VISLFKRPGEGVGESEAGKNLDLCLIFCADSEPTSKQARIGVPSFFTWSCSSDSLVEKALPELQTYTVEHGCQLLWSSPSSRSLTLVEDG